MADTTRPWTPYAGTPATTTKATMPPGNVGQWAVIIAILALVLWQGYQQRQVPGPTPGPDPVIVEPDEDQQQDTQPDDKDQADGQTDGTYLVVVSESKGRSEVEVSALNQYAFWREYLPAKGMRWYLLDPDDKDATGYVNWAAKKNKKPPFIMHVNGSEPQWLGDFPPKGYDMAAPDLGAYKAQLGD